MSVQFEIVDSIAVVTIDRPEVAARTRDSARANRVEPDGDGPLGPTRMLLGEPVGGSHGGGRSGARDLVRPPGRRARRGLRRRLPALERSSDRRGAIRLPRLIGHSHALELILTGRGVGGDEALRMALVNRLARSRAAHPQAALRGDRLSSYEQWSLPLDEALSVERRHGRVALATGEITAGLERFARGTWREGS
jgi:enoyl-CoA hydratase